MTKVYKEALLIVAILGVMFQIGHFAEHAYQFWHWLAIERSAPWKSDFAHWLAMTAGGLVSPDLCGDKVMMARGMEVLHTVGNLIFLATLAAIWLLTRAKLVGWSFVIEFAHLWEHIALTVSVLWFDRAIGASTLFGYAPGLLSKEGAVGYRVGWHFVLNMIPTMMMVQWMMAKVPVFHHRRMAA